MWCVANVDGIQLLYVRGPDVSSRLWHVYPVDLQFIQNQVKAGYLDVIAATVHNNRKTLQTCEAD